MTKQLLNHSNQSFHISVRNWVSVHTLLYILCILFFLLMHILILCVFCFSLLCLKEAPVKKKFLLRDKYSDPDPDFDCRISLPKQSMNGANSLIMFCHAFI